MASHVSVFCGRAQSPQQRHLRLQAAQRGRGLAAPGGARVSAETGRAGKAARPLHGLPGEGELLDREEGAVRLVQALVHAAERAGTQQLAALPGERGAVLGLRAARVAAAAGRGRRRGPPGRQQQTAARADERAGRRAGRVGGGRRRAGRRVGPGAGRRFERRERLLLLLLLLRLSLRRRLPGLLLRLGLVGQRLRGRFRAEVAHAKPGQPLRAAQPRPHSWEDAVPPKQLSLSRAAQAVGLVTR